MLVKKITALSSVALMSTSALLLGQRAKADNDSDHVADAPQEPSPRIAVIGGGIGGTSCAYFLQELFGDSAHIDLYENDRIGGRLRIQSVGGRDYEFGGSIIHPKNKYMVDFTKKFGLKPKNQVEVLNGAFNGDEFVFVESSWSVITALKMVWRYGWSNVWKLGREVNHMLKTFHSIYDLQTQEQSFSTVHEMMAAMGGDEFVRMTETPMDQLFREKKFSDKFIAEVVSLATRVSYGQDPDMSAFAGSVALAGVGPGLWSVEGGNKRVAEKFLEESVKTSIHRRVTKVTLCSPSKGEERPVYQLTHVLSDDPKLTEYDIVVVAVPLSVGVTQVPVEFKGFPDPVGPFPGRYQTTVTTYLKGTLDPEAFGREPGEELPGSIITTKDIPLNIRSVAKNYPVDVKTGDKSVWAYKIFSEKELTDEELERLFLDRNTMSHVSWHAYPLYEKVDLDKLAPFNLHEGLFYVNTVEWAVSCMEMSVIGAKNVSLLARDYWAQNEKVV